MSAGLAARLPRFTANCIPRQKARGKWVMSSISCQRLSHDASGSRRSLWAAAKLSEKLVERSCLGLVRPP